MEHIEKILSLPEGKTIEFKRDLSSMLPILRTLVAFANTAGGTLVIGRDDNGSLIGINNIFEGEEKIANAIADSIHPPLMPEIESASAEGKSLLIVRVPHWRGPFYLKKLGPEAGVYVRLGSTNRVAGPELLDELKRSISKISFDQLPCLDTSVESLDMERVQRSFEKVNRDVDTNKLESLGILVPYSGKLVCSNGGLILFGRNELREKFFPNTVVRCARFRGAEKVDFIDQYDVHGTIIEAMEEVPKFIKRNTRLAAKIEGIQRENIPEYSPVAVREVLTNALVHADYSIRGMHPRVAIFSNRLEIESPGMFPFGYALEDFLSGVSHIRNKVIARVFRELNLMEEWGTGYKRIVEVCHTRGYTEPVWQEFGTAVRVLFQPHSATFDELELPTQESGETLTARQRKIVSLFQDMQTLTAKEVFHHLGETITERTLRNDLLHLKEKGFLKITGSGPSATWNIINHNT